MRPPPRGKGWRSTLGGVVVAAALLAVFAAYLRPDMAMTLANQLWACF